MYPSFLPIQGSRNRMKPTSNAPKPPVSNPKNCRFATQKEVAEWLELSTRTIRMWIEAGCPGKQADGLYDAMLMQAWYQDPNRNSIDHGWRWRGDRYRP